VVLGAVFSVLGKGVETCGIAGTDGLRFERVGLKASDAIGSVSEPKYSAASISSPTL